MDFLPIRLLPDADLRRTLEATLGERRYDAAYVIGGIGSLRQARLRYAGKNDAEFLDGDLEILTLSGSLSPDGVHLHMSVADATGRVIGGHVGYDCIVRTTAEVLLVPLPQWTFAREMDPGTGFPELVVRRKP